VGTRPDIVCAERAIHFAFEKQDGEVRARTSDYQEYLDESDDFLVKQGFMEVELGERSNDSATWRRY